MENTKSIKMESVYVNKIIYTTKVNVQLVHLTLGFQKMESNVNVKRTIIGTHIKIHVII